MLNEIAATPVSDLTKREPARAKPNTPLSDVIAAMNEMGRGATIILDHDGRIAGIFTERDLMLRVDHGVDGWQQQPVREYMTKDPVTISADQSVATALRRMNEGTFRHLPVTDGEGKLSSILSIRDILSHLVEFFPQEFLNLPPDPEHEANSRWGG